MSDGVIIIGAGQAGIQAAASLRAEGYEDCIRIVADESDMPYQKPPLSKGFLMDVQKEENLFLRAPDYYEGKNIELILGDAVNAINTSERKLTLASGTLLSYDNLVLATGASNRIIKIPGHELAGIHYLRSMEDGRQLKKKLSEVRQIVVVGGGFIGLEIAAAARERGIEVTVIEVLDKLMARVLPPVVSDVFKAKHHDKGVKILFNSKAVKFTGSQGNVSGVELDNGEVINADIVVVGIGVLPNDRIARDAGIKCDNGILVDEQTQTSEPGIFAIGDCAAHFNAFIGEQTRLESVQNAVDQAKTAAANIRGNTVKYNQVPWFWTHQFELKLQMAGCNNNFDDYVIRGDVAEQRFSAYYYKDDQLIGVDSINKASDHLSARKLIQAGVSPSRDQAADIEFKLKSLLVAKENAR